MTKTTDAQWSDFVSQMNEWDAVCMEFALQAGIRDCEEIWQQVGPNEALTILSKREKFQEWINILHKHHTHLLEDPEQNTETP